MVARVTHSLTSFLIELKCLFKLKCCQAKVKATRHRLQPRYVYRVHWVQGVHWPNKSDSGSFSEQAVYRLYTSIYRPNIQPVCDWRWLSLTSHNMLSGRQKAYWQVHTPEPSAATGAQVVPGRWNHHWEDGGDTQPSPAAQLHMEKVVGLRHSLPAPGQTSYNIKLGVIAHHSLLSEDLSSVTIKYFL